MSPWCERDRGGERVSGLRTLRALPTGIVLTLCLAASPPAAGSPDPRPQPPTSVRVSARPGGGPVIPAGFLGLSLEYTAVEPYAGVNPHLVNPVFERLVSNLAGEHPVLRIGGDSTDWAWWPVRGIRRPPGVRITLTPRWLAVTRTLTRDLGARLILGINFEADDARLAAAESRALLRGLGGRSVEALELGNEPELYHSFAWYRTAAGQEVPGRPAGYGFPMFSREFASIVRGLPHVALAGPTTGASRWLAQWRAFLTREPRVKVATVHRYGLHDCTNGARSPGYPTPRHLLGAAAAVEPAVTVRPFVRIAHADHVPLRIDEMNSTPCYNVAPVAARSFASALWALDALFELASVGVDGVNIHTYPGAPYALFAFTSEHGRWHAAVSAEYYGLLMFAQAAPPGSRLLRLRVASGGVVRAWATAGPGGVRRFVLINVGDRAHAVTLSGLPGSATVRTEALQAPSIDSPSGVTLGGRTFGRDTSTGSLAGQARGLDVRREANGGLLSVPAGSAVLVTVG